MIDAQTKHDPEETAHDAEDFTQAVIDLALRLNKLGATARERQVRFHALFTRYNVAQHFIWE